MRLKSEDNAIFSNVKNQKTFTIAATAKAFRILSDGLYSRKIEAIIRELSCNAYDSHVQAGIPERPFKVHLPNEWEPEFSVEDFGLGLDDEDIENIYTSYFTSTKTDSNDVIGALGLGSKTPFSYTDSFTIRSRKNGMEWNYSAFIGASGEPSVSLMGKHETAEGNGVKITVPVKASDYYKFLTDARIVFKWFVVMPEVSGNDSFQVSNEKAIELLEHDYIWSVYGKNNSYDKNFITAVMGNVAYHVPNVNTTFAEDLKKGEIGFFENNALIIKFDIGDLDVAASRETISFDEDTKEIFLGRIRDIIQGFSKKTQDKINSEATSISDAFKIVQADVGLWASDIFTYDGVSLNEIENHHKVNNLISHIFSLRNQNKLDSTYYQYYHYRINQQSVEFSTIRFSELAGIKSILIVQGQPRGYVNNIRKKMNRDHNFCFVSKYLLDDFQKNALIQEFGDIFDFCEASVWEDEVLEEKRKKREEAKEARAEERRRKREEAILNGELNVDEVGDDEVKIRAKKTQARINYYNLATNSITEEVVVDSSFVDDQRYIVGFLNRGTIDLPIVDIKEHDVSHFYHYCMTFGIDKIIFVKNVAKEKTLRIFGNGLTHDDIKDNKNLVNWTFIFDCKVAKKFHYCTFDKKITIHNGYHSGSIISMVYVKKHGEDDSELVKTINKRIASYEMELDVDFIPPNVKYHCSFDHEFYLLENSKEKLIEKLIKDYPLLGTLQSYTKFELVEPYIDMVDKLKEIEENALPEDEIELNLSQVA